MGEYRAYVIGADGHIALRVDLVVPDETTARKRASSLSMDMLLSFGKAQPGSKDLSQNSKGERRRARNASPPGGALVSN